MRPTIETYEDPITGVPKIRFIGRVRYNRDKKKEPKINVPAVILRAMKWYNEDEILFEPYPMGDAIVIKRAHPKPTSLRYFYFAVMHEADWSRIIRKIQEVDKRPRHRGLGKYMSAWKNKEKMILDFYSKFPEEFDMERFKDDCHKAQTIYAQENPELAVKLQREHELKYRDSHGTITSNEREEFCKLTAEIQRLLENKPLIRGVYVPQRGRLP